MGVGEVLTCIRVVSALAHGDIGICDGGFSHEEKVTGVTLVKDCEHSDDGCAHDLTITGGIFKV